MSSFAAARFRPAPRVVVALVLALLAGLTRATHVFEPGNGDLLVMGGCCQAEWEHTVPKSQSAVGARMSVTIRHSQPAAGEHWLRPNAVEGASDD